MKDAVEFKAPVLLRRRQGARRERRLRGEAVANVVRPEAAAAIAEIRRMGIRIVLLTGDATSIAKEVGKRPKGALRAFVEKTVQLF